MPSDGPTREPAAEPPEGDKAGFFAGTLHPATLLLALLRQLRQLVFIAIPVLIVSREGAAPILFMAVLLSIPGLMFALVRFLSFRWRLSNGELSIGHGIVARVNRSIPVERIQNVDLEQGPVHRLLGVAEVRVETAGGQGVEASLSVLGLAEAQRLRLAVLRARERRMAAAGIVPADGVAPEDPGTSEGSGRRSGLARGERAGSLLYRLDPIELLVAGITRTRLGPLLVVLAFPLQVMELFAVDQERVAQQTQQFLERVQIPGGAGGALLALVVGVALLGLAVLISIGGTTLLFGGFQLRRVGDDLRRFHGVITVRAGTLPRSRVQVLRLEQTVLQRLAKRATIQADTAGSPQEGREINGRDTLIPSTPVRTIQALLADLLPSTRGESWPPAWFPVHPLSTWRYFVRGVVLIGFGAFFLVRASGLQGLWLLALVPVLLPVAHLRTRTFGYRLGSHHFFARRGWWTRRTFVLPLHKIQGVSLRHGPLDRALGLATLLVDTAGQTRRGHIAVPDLPEREARELMAALGAAAAKTEFVW